MKNLISIFLIIKSLLRQKYTKEDMIVAYSLMTWWNIIYGQPAPAWLQMVANLKEDAVLPEVWADFTYELKADLFPGNDHQDYRGGA
jgi:hypothetical protein